MDTCRVEPSPASLAGSRLTELPGAGEPDDDDGRTAQVALFAGYDFGVDGADVAGPVEYPLVVAA